LNPHSLVQRFTAQELNTFLNDNNTPPLLLDVREPWEFEIAHIGGSILLPMHQIPSSLDQFTANQEIVLICHHGIRSRQVAYFLESAGFTNLINLEGGVNAWAHKVDHKMAKY